MNTVIGVLVGIVIGCCWSNSISRFFRVEQRKQIGAIMNKFDCEKNDFTYCYEGVEDFYIVAFEDKEYRIKFSLNRPCQVVYCQEIVIVE